MCRSMHKYITLKIPKVFVNLPEKDAKRIILRELAIRLYQKEIISLGKAAEMAHLSVAEFMKLLSEEGISINYDEESLKEDQMVVDRLVEKQKNKSNI